MPKWTALLCLLPIALAGCKQHHTEAYYMAHPKVLSKRVASCEKQHSKTNDCRRAYLAYQRKVFAPTKLPLNAKGVGY